MNTEVIYTDGFSKFFQVRILQDFYLKKFYFDNNLLKMDTTAAPYLLENYDVWKDFDIRPTEECAKLLRDYHIIYRRTPQGFATLILNDGGSKPKIELPADVTFQFLMFLKNPDFFNFTALPLDGLPSVQDMTNMEYYKSIYLFSNDQNNLVFPYLTNDGEFVTFSDRTSSKDYPVTPATMGLINLRVESTTFTAFNMFNSDSTFRSPSYEVKFDLRYTRWQYLNQDNTQYSITAPLPLTNAGINPVYTNATSQYLPSAGTSMIHYDPATIDLDYPDSNKLSSKIYL